MRQAKDNHRSRRDQEAGQHDRAPPQPVGQFTAGQLRNERAGPEERDHQGSLADGDRALAGQVKGQEGNDEAAESVDQRTGPDQPVCGWQAFGQRLDAIFDHAFLGWEKLE